MSKATDPIEGYYAQQKAPTIREVLEDVYSDADGIHEQATLELAERVEAVLRLHERKDPSVHPNFPRDYCFHCAEDWPCPTIRALDGEPESAHRRKP